MNLSSRRAVFRVAWRHARLSASRSALVILMIGFPIAALVSVATVIQSAIPTASELTTQQMGLADYRVIPTKRTGIKDLAQALPLNTTVVSRQMHHVAMVNGATQLTFEVTEFSLPVDDAMFGGMFVELHGPAPARSREIALQPNILSILGLDVGEQIRLPGMPQPLSIVGTIRGATDTEEPLGVVGPGTLASEGERAIPESYLVQLPGPIDAVALTGSFFSSDSWLTFSRADTTAAQEAGRLELTGGAFAAALLLVCGTGLIVAAAFVVAAERSLRRFGLLLAVGAAPKQVRASLLLEGSVLGAIGSVVGIAVGVGIGLVGRPYLPDLVHHSIGPARIPALPLIGALVLGTLAATGAAYAPARSAAKVDCVDALAGRLPTPRNPGRLALLGAIAVPIGVGVVAASSPLSSDLLMAIGLGVVVMGILVSIPLLVTVLGLPASRLPMPFRLALRDIARHGRRTAGALAAAALALALPMGIATFALSSEANANRVPPMADDQAVVSFVGQVAGIPAQDRLALLARLRNDFPDAIVMPLEEGVVPGTDGAPRMVWVEGPQVTGPQGMIRATGQLLVGGPETLTALHAQSGISDLIDGQIIAIGPGGVDNGKVRLTFEPGSRPFSEHRAVEAGSQRYSALGYGEYTYVISVEEASRLGVLSSSESGSEPILFRGSSALSRQMIQQVKSVVGRTAGASVVSGFDFEKNSDLLRSTSLLVGAVVALGVVAIAIALVGAESRRERSVMSSVGASPRNRRSLAGSTAWLLAITAGLLAVPLGFLPVAVYRWSQGLQYPIAIPWSGIVLTIGVVPAIAGAIAAVTSRLSSTTSLLNVTNQ